MTQNLRVLSYVLISMFIAGCASNKIKNTVTETAAVSGNCGMCKQNIENAGTEKNVSKVVWSADAQEATITYDKTKTTKNAILQKIANAGYTNEAYKGDWSAYQALPACCQYKEKEDEPHDHDSHDHKHPYMAKPTAIDDMEKTGLNWLYEGSYKLTTAMKTEDYEKVADLSGSLYRGIDLVADSTIYSKAISAWKLYRNVIQTDVSAMANNPEIQAQRAYLSRFSQNVFALMKKQNPTKNSYLYACSMEGVNNNRPYYWISNSAEDKIMPYGFSTFCGVVADKIIVE